MVKATEIQGEHANDGGLFLPANHFELLYLAFNVSRQSRINILKPRAVSPAKGVQQPRTLGDD